MPYPRRRRAPLRRRAPYRKGRRAAPRRKYGGRKQVGIHPIVQMGNAGIADRALVKMKYQVNTTLTNTQPNTWAAWVFRMNSLYDTEYFAGGHQPLTYDQWGLFYGMYRVYKVRIDFDIANQQTTGTQVGLTFQPNDPTIPFNASAFERPHTFSKIAGGVNGQNRIKLSRTVYMPSIAGMTTAQYRANEDVAALWNFNPNFINYGILFAHGLDNSTTPNLTVNATITFFTELFDRLELNVSSTDPEKFASTKVTPEQMFAVTDPTTGLLVPATVSVKTPPGPHRVP